MDRQSRAHGPTHCPTGFRPRLALALTVAAAPLVAAGCASPASEVAVRPIDLGAFAAPAPPGAAPPPAAAPPPVERPEAGPMPGPPLVARGPGLLVVPDRAPAERALRPGDRVIVDSLVGQVNARPIFADEFFEPIEDRLLALSAQSNPREFLDRAAEIVMSELRLVVINALYLAEAESQLTVQEQQGIRAWLRQVEGRVVSLYEGIEERARREILAEQGRSFDSYMEGLRDRALIQKLLQERIEPRVIVSWRDVQREYERRRAEFNPPASVTLARIRLFTERQADLVETVRQRLENGEDFLALAEELGPSAGGIMDTYQVEGGDLTTIGFRDETLREALGRLRRQSDTTGPFQVGATTWWLHLAAVEQETGRSLYDPTVQRLLAAELRARRGTEEQDRYVATLLERGIYDELDGMLERLLRIAVLRYGP